MALAIGDAKSGAAIVAEIKFRQVAVQVSLAAMLVDSDHAALEDGEHVFNGVRMDDAVGFVAHVFAASVLDRSVVCELFSGDRIEVGLVQAGRTT